MLIHLAQTVRSCDLEGQDVKIWISRHLKRSWAFFKNKTCHFQPRVLLHFIDVILCKIFYCASSDSDLVCLSLNLTQNFLVWVFIISLSQCTRLTTNSSPRLSTLLLIKSIDVISPDCKCHHSCALIDHK